VRCCLRFFLRIEGLLAVGVLNAHGHFAQASMPSVTAWMVNFEQRGRRLHIISIFCRPHRLDRADCCLQMQLTIGPHKRTVAVGIADRAQGDLQAVECKDLARVDRTHRPPALRDRPSVMIFFLSARFLKRSNVLSSSASFSA